MGKVSGDLDGVVEVVGDVGREREDEVAAKGVGDAGEGAESLPAGVVGQRARSRGRAAARDSSTVVPEMA